MASKKLARVEEVRTGMPAPWARSRSRGSSLISGMVKRPVTDRPVRCTAGEGLDGNMAHKPFHRTDGRAVLAFAREEFEPLLAAAAALEGAPMAVLRRTVKVGLFGENLSTTGVTPDEVCIGDRWRVGTAVLRVTQPRFPCWQLSANAQWAAFAFLAAQRGATGWFMAIEKDGEIEAGDEMELLERPHPDLTIRRVQQLFALPVETAMSYIEQRKGGRADKESAGTEYAMDVSGADMALARKLAACEELDEFWRLEIAAGFVQSGGCIPLRGAHAQINQALNARVDSGAGWLSARRLVWVLLLAASVAVCLYVLSLDDPDEPELLRQLRERAAEVDEVRKRAHSAEM